MSNTRARGQRRLPRAPTTVGASRTARVDVSTHVGRASPALTGIILTVFAAFFIGLSVHSYTQTSATWDEPVHVTAGYAGWVKQDFRVDRCLAQLNAPLDVAGPSTPTRADIETRVKRSSLTISKIRVESTPRDETSAVLRFDMSNGGSGTLTEVEFQISLVDESCKTDAPGRVVAGPFRIQAKLVLEPGDTAEYEVLLRSVPPDCRCAARVRVLSVRSLSESGA